MSVIRRFSDWLGRLWSRPGARTVILAVVWTAAALNLVRGYRYALASGSPNALGDFRVYLEATTWMRSGSPLYDFITGNGFGFYYPPFAALLLAPFGMMSVAAAQTLWTCINLFSLVVMGVVTGLRVCPTWGREQRWVLAGVLVSLFSQTVVVQANLSTGNISLILAVLSLVECSRLFRSKRWASLSGVAAAVKLTPALFLLFHLVADRRRALWSIGTAAAVTVLGAAVLPRETWTFVTKVLGHTSSIGEAPYLGNLTWLGVVVRLGLDGSVGRLAGLTIGLVTAVAAVWNAHRHWREAPLVATAIIGCASVVAAPLSWPHHAVWVLVWAVCAVFSTSRAWRFVGLGIVVLLLVWTPVSNLVGATGGAALSAVLVITMSLAAVADVRRSPQPS